GTHRIEISQPWLETQGPGWRITGPWIDLRVEQGEQGTRLLLVDSTCTRPARIMFGPLVEPLPATAEMNEQEEEPAGAEPAVIHLAIFTDGAHVSVLIGAWVPQAIKTLVTIK